MEQSNTMEDIIFAKFDDKILHTDHKKASVNDFSTLDQNTQDNLKRVLASFKKDDKETIELEPAQFLDILAYVMIQQDMNMKF